MSRNKQEPLSELQRQVLELLFEYRKLDSTTIRNQIAPEMSRQSFHNFLAKLQVSRLIATRMQPGEASIISLTKSGAEAIGKEIKTQHYKAVGTRTLQHRQAQLKLENTSQKLGLIIFRERAAAPGDKTIIRETPVRLTLIEHYIVYQRHRLNQLAHDGRPDYEAERDLRAGIHPVPTAFRDYFLHLPGRTGAVVILSRPTSDRRFWLAKCDEFVNLAASVPVLAVFTKPPPVTLQTELKGAGFKLCTIEKFEAAISKLLGIGKSLE